MLVRKWGLGWVPVWLILNTAVANASPVEANVSLLLEELARHSQTLLTEMELTNSIGYVIDPRLIFILRQTSQPRKWGRDFTDVVIPEWLTQEGRQYLNGSASSLPPQQAWAGLQRYLSPEGADYQIEGHLNLFRRMSMRMYKIWKRNSRNPSAVKAQFAELQPAYFNALAASYFYIEALRRTYLVSYCFQPGRNVDLLVQRLKQLAYLNREITELMHVLRQTAVFYDANQAKQPCPECTLGADLLDVEAVAPARFRKFPFFANGNAWRFTSQPQFHRADYRSSYDAAAWYARWDFINWGLTGSGNQARRANFTARPGTQILPPNKTPAQPAGGPPPSMSDPESGPLPDPIPPGALLGGERPYIPGMSQQEGSPPPAGRPMPQSQGGAGSRMAPSGEGDLPPIPPELPVIRDEDESAAG